MFHRLDHLRLQFETGMVLNCMGKPRVRDVARLMPVGHYHGGAPVCEWVFKFQRPGMGPMFVLTNTDAATEESFHHLCVALRTSHSPRQVLVEATFGICFFDGEEISNVHLPESTNLCLVLVSVAAPNTLPRNSPSPSHSHHSGVFLNSMLSPCSLAAPVSLLCDAPEGDAARSLSFRCHDGS